MSVDNTTASEVTAADATSLPEHDFIKKLINQDDKICCKCLDYRKRQPVSRNVHKEETVSTNKNSEGYNSKLGSKIKQHPNSN